MNTWILAKKDYICLYERCKDASPFQSPDVIEILIRNYWPYYIKDLCIPQIALCYDSNDNPVFGCVLLKFLTRKEYCVIGNVTGYNVAGGIYSNIDFIDSSLNAIKEKIQSPIKWYKIYPDNPLIKYAVSKPIPYPAARIIVNTSYEDHISHLSKSVRQNIRTAYNRLATDNKSYKIFSLDNNGYRQYINDIQQLSRKRHEEKYLSKTSFLKKFFLKHLSFATLMYKKSSQSLSFLLFIDGKPAAMMNGLIRGNHYIIPRLAIDSDFKRYSPGMILVNEALKHLMKTHDQINFDLSFGHEKYKFDMGAEAYDCLSFTT
ncbi:MAG: GNAT family N-acetyltransferase [Muribaculum sp.]|nr:GNAT family N-acetyltransferase [Muribaculum sp.]